MALPLKRHRERRRPALLAAGLAAVMAACGSGGSGTPASTSASGTHQSLPAPPSTLPNKGTFSATVTGSGSINETITLTTPYCSASVNGHATFSIKGQQAALVPTTGQLVLGPFPITGTASGGGNTSCANGAVPSWDANIPAADMLIDPGNPAKLVIPAPANVTSAYAEGAASGNIVVLPSAGGPPLSWVLSSATGLQSGPGTISCKGETTGESVPVTLAGTPTLPPPVCEPKQPTNFKGDFTVSAWPCYAAAGHFAGIGAHVSCQGTGSVSLEIDFQRVTLAPNLVVTPPVLRFLQTAVGGTTPAQTVTITNAEGTGGTVPLVIPGLGVPGPANPDYQLKSTTMPSSCFLGSQSGSNWNGCDGAVIVNPGQSVTFTVAFTPSATGVRDANLTIVSNDTNPYDDIALYGVGLAAPGG